MVTVRCSSKRLPLNLHQLTLNDGGQMPLQEIYYIAEMVVSAAVIISIVFVAIELRQNTYLMRATMADQRKQNVNWFFERLVTDGI